MSDVPSRLGAWADLPFFTADWPGIETSLAAETRTILPPEASRFAALEHTQPQATRVVILGQDPYPTPGHANGLAFSVTPETPLPRSLRNIFRELQDDLGAAPATGDLTPWADQGVLLLNTALTVPSGEAGGHANLGWSRLAEQVLARLDDCPRAFLLWGNHARKLGQTLSDHHLRVETAHPSPLSASRGFFGSRPFSRVNAWLAARGDSPISWA
ncbi:MAG: uracil-DNA glycosylase [Silicimonas sp.]|jgi:uracil-DNA glycosylase|nr:uracil-DNA glycosylase [Silicimonas sp.]